MGKLLFKNAICKILAFSILFSTFFYDSSTNFYAEETRKAASTIKITVGKASQYQYKTIKDALASIKLEPTEQSRAIISIASGVYEEDLTVNIPYVTFENASSNNPNDVIIKYDKANGNEDKLKKFEAQKAGTLILEKNAKGFNAKNITIQNSYNLQQQESDNINKQLSAPALVNFADKVMFENCNFIGRQNTLFLKQGSYENKEQTRVYLKNCYVEGTTDYIYGDSTAVFEDCKINMAYYEKDLNYISANTKIFDLGFVFINCNFTVDKKYNENTENKTYDIYLGRPWKEESQNSSSYTALINCQIPDNVKLEGWLIASNYNRARYMEYKSVNKERKTIDISKRDTQAKILDAEQANAYNVYNILRGTDGWNPKEDGKRSDKIKVADITVDKYNLEIALGEKATIQANILPLNANDMSVLWSSSDDNIVTVDNNGNITAIKEGKAQIIVTSNDGGFKAVSHIVVSKPQTDLPSIKEINIEHKDAIYPGDILKGNYSYVLNSDNSIDKANVKWYSIDSNTGEELLLKEGDKESDKSYNVTVSDIGCKIKLVVIPETETTYGKKGEAVSYITTVDVNKPAKNAPKIYLRESFSNFFEEKYQESNSNKYPLNLEAVPIWKGSTSSKNSDTNSWDYIESDESSFIGGAFIDNSSLLEYIPKENENKWGNVSVDAHMRFNTNAEGFAVDSYYDFYTLYNGIENSYYKLRIERGENTDSLNLYLYKKADSKSEEVLLASDEKSLLNKLPQNLAEKNPWFKVNQTIYNGNINISVTLDGENTLLTMTVADNSPLKDGYIALESGKNKSALLISSLVVREAKKENNDDKIKVYLAGDSTVKMYGDDNTIGGWGEYLQYYFNNDDVEIINKAEGGRSTRSFLNQGRLDEILSEIRKDDYLFIQFGHNDGLTTNTARLEHSVFLGEPDKNGIYPTLRGEKTKTPQLLLDFYKDYPYNSQFYPYESGTFKWYLKQYIIRAKEKGAIPVLITPVARVFFDENGKITPHHGPSDGYVKAVLQVADETNTVCVDMFSITKQMYEDYGVKVTEGLQNIKADGSIDITHYNKFGSNIVTSLFVKALAEQNIAIANKEIESSKFVSKTEDLRSANLFILGDSTACDYNDDNNINYAVPRNGWGTYIGNYLVDKIKVKNLALDGASSKSFIQEENYQTFLSSVKEGDYVIVQFGHYDEKNKYNESNPNKYTSLEGDKDKDGSFKNYLYKYYIKVALDKKAVPILLTPSSRRVFNSNGDIEDTHGLYDDAVRELASELKVAYVDFTAVTAENYKKMGTDNSKSMQAVYKNNNGIDETNYSKYGADLSAKLILNQLKFSSATLKSYIDDNAVNNESSNNITRAEYISLLMRVLNKDEVPRNNFLDVSKGKTYTNAVGLAKQMGIAEADEKGYFYPEDFLTKKDIKIFTEKALKNEGKLQNLDLSLLNNINDDEFIKNEQAYSIINKVYSALY